MFLLDDLATTPIINPDSVKAETIKVLQMAHEDPSTFWSLFGEHILRFGLKVLAALVIYFIGAWVIRRVRKILNRVFLRRNTEATLASFIVSFVSIMLTVLVLILTVSTLGVDTTSLAALLAAGGMAIGMALSGTVQNFAGGIMLLVFKPFKVGDFIEAQGYMGTVQDVNIVSTKILTLDNHEIVLPNGALSNGNINNYSAQSFRRVDWSLSVAYGTDAEALKQLVLEFLYADQRVLTSKDKKPVVNTINKNSEEPVPDPFVALVSLNANDITFTVRAWTLNENYWNLMFDMQEKFYTELPKHGINFAYPHCDITITNPQK